VRLADAPSARSLSWVLHSFSSFSFLAGPFEKSIHRPWPRQESNDLA
jgi:hypothetical protein